MEVLSQKFWEESVTFQAVAVDFTSEEWHLLDYDQKIRYWDVMLENLRNLISVDPENSRRQTWATRYICLTLCPHICVFLWTEHPVTKTDVIFKVEQGHELWKVGKDNLNWSYTEVFCLLGELERKKGSREFSEPRYVYHPENINEEVQSCNWSMSRISSRQKTWRWVKWKRVCLCFLIVRELWRKLLWAL